MFNKINDKWNSWSQTPLAKKELAIWRLKEPSLRHWDLCQLGKPAFGAQRVDEMQASLVRLTQANFSYAGLALVLQLRPALKNLSKFSKCPAERDSEVLSYFYEVLLSRDLNKRPNKIAANLVLDTKQKLYRKMMKANRLEKTLQSQSVVEYYRKESAWGIESPIVTVEIIKSALNMQKNTQSNLRLSEIAFRHWIVGDSIQEIADKFSLSKTAVTTKLWRLRKKIKEIQNASEVEHLAA